MLWFPISCANSAISYIMITKAYMFIGKTFTEKSNLTRHRRTHSHPQHQCHTWGVQFLAVKSVKFSTYLQTAKHLVKCTRTRWNNLWKFTRLQCGHYTHKFLFVIWILTMNRNLITLLLMPDRHQWVNRIRRNNHLLDPPLASDVERHNAGKTPQLYLISRNFTQTMKGLM